MSGCSPLTASGFTWWIMAPQASLVTLYLHGNAGNVTHRFLQIREITAGGSSVLMLDYRGYGKSGGSPSEHGLYADADAAYLYLLDHGYSARHIVLQGESLGTAVAVDLASRKECAGVVLEAAFTSGRDVANTVLPLIGPYCFGVSTRKARSPRSARRCCSSTASATRSYL
jgi:uncharacterized protein